MLVDHLYALANASQPGKNCIKNACNAKPGCKPCRYCQIGSPLSQDNALEQTSKVARSDIELPEIVDARGKCNPCVYQMRQWCIDHVCRFRHSCCTSLTLPSLAKVAWAKLAFNSGKSAENVISATYPPPSPKTRLSIRHPRSSDLRMD